MKEASIYMKKKVKILFIIIIFLIVCIPAKFNIKDGGSYGYRALLYEITYWNAGVSAEEKTSGVTIKLFGVLSVYDSFHY